MTKICLRAFAKVNYALEVRGKREDGYHEILSVMQSVSLADEVEIEHSREGFDIAVEPEGAKVGPARENTVYKAQKILAELVGFKPSVKARLHKRIPAGAGLGGGSADAAAMLVGLNELFGLGLSPVQLREVGLRVGADVPFCLSGGTGLGGGIGEVLKPLPAPPQHHLIIIKPAASTSTTRIYHAYDEHPEVGTSSVAPVVKALRAGDLYALARSLGNDLAPVTKCLVPKVETLEEELRRLGAFEASMSGSGTAVFGIFGSEVEARRAASGLLTSFVGVCEPVDYGVELL